MTDLSEPFYIKVGTLLEAQRTALARYAGLFEAQRAALRSNDLELLAEVATQAAYLLESLEGSGRHLTMARGPLAETTGPRSESVRSTLAAIAVELEEALAGVRQSSQALQERRDRLVRTIMDETGTLVPRPGNSFRAGPAGSAFLDRSG